MSETREATLPVPTVTSLCSTATRTVTSHLPPSTHVIESTVLQYSSSEVTSQATTTANPHGIVHLLDVDIGTACHRGRLVRAGPASVV